MPQRKVQRFFSKYPTRTFDAGVIMFLPSEDPPGVFWIESGQIIQYEVSPTGEKVILNTYQTPAFFPMSWAINRTPNRFFVEVSERVSVKIAPPAEVLVFLEKNPDVTLDLLSRVYRGAEGLLQRMSLLMGGTAKSRVIFELSVCARRFGNQLSENEYDANLTEAQLGARCGLSRETVSRELNKLKSADLIAVKRGSIKIFDLPRLEKILDNER